MGSLDNTNHIDQLLPAFFANAPIGGSAIATDGGWRVVNPALARMLGYTVDELQSTSLEALTHADDLPAVTDGLRRLLAAGCETWAIEKRLRTKNSGYLWVHATTRLQRDAAGTPEHIITYVVDITTRKAADDEVRSSEEKYRRLFEAAKDGILIVDARTGHVVDANPFMSELTGYARGDFVGKYLWDIGPFADIAASKASFAELQAQDFVRYDDLPLKTADGRMVDVEFVSNVYLVHGTRVIQCNVRDITARKRMEREARLRERAIAAVSQGILITDALAPDQPIVYASPGFTAITGYSADEAMGRNCRFLQGPDSEPAAIGMVREAVARGGGCVVELLNYRKDGTTFWNNVSISPVKDDDGTVTNFVGVQTDVTVRRNLEAQYRQAQKMEAIGRLAGGVAHDFNNLLTVILSHAELLGEDLKPDDPLGAGLKEIGDAALRATELTRQLLAFSRQQVLETRVLNLNVVLAGLDRMLRRLLGADVEITLLPAAGLGNVVGDQGQIEQIVMNLAVNARDAMRRGGLLTIETANVELDLEYARVHHEVPAGSYVLMAVSDNGIGIDRDTLPRIFEPFFTTKAEGKGTGLGLATVFGIVKQSGGHIFVYSEPGAGTTFKIYLPRVRAAADLPSPLLPPAGSAGAGGTILLVEDEQQLRALATAILRRNGYVVLDAANGGEALLVCEQHGGNIDLLLTDVVLPRMSGRQLAERLAPLRPAMAVLYMSGYADDAVLQHGILESREAFLAKPFTPNTLTRRVAEVLRAWRAGGSARPTGQRDAPGPSPEVSGQPE
ncbi:MAG: PAS domain S-box protein [Vicinamibacteraceae bacterium]